MVYEFDVDTAIRIVEIYNARLKEGNKGELQFSDLQKGEQELYRAAVESLTIYIKPAA